MNPFFVSILALLVAMLSIQSGASFAKQLFPLVGPVGATVLRLVLGSSILLVAWRPWKGKLSRKEWLQISLYGASLGLMNLLFYLAIARIPLGVAVALEFTGPLAVALFSSKRLSDLVWAFLALLGILLILPTGTFDAGSKEAVSHTLQFGANFLDPLGIAFALGAGCCWALYILFGQRAGSSVQGGRVASLGMLVATAVVLPFGAIYAPAHLFQLDVLPLGLLVAILSTALPYSLEMIALKRMSAKTFGILMSLEPAVAALSGLVFLNERLLLTQWLAIFCVISASAGSSFSERKRNNEKMIEALA